jgi:uncharacterized OB-fold protein
MTADRGAPIAQRPLPKVTPLTEPFWSAARERWLLLQHCAECGRYQFPPEPACTRCGSERLEWSPASGRATLYSWTVCHPPLLPYFAERAPWPVAAVELAEGPRMVTQLIEVAVEEYAIGMTLVADFEDVDSEITLIVFRRA